MTVTTVNGVEVVATEPVESPLSKGGDTPINFKRVRRLLLADDTEMYGCTECDHVGDTPMSVTAHLGHVHPLRQRANGKHPKRTPALDPDTVTLGELLAGYRRAEAMQESLDRMAEDRDQWRTRARDAERRLKMLRSALREGGVS